jgi:hypothetical protein
MAPVSPTHGYLYTSRPSGPRLRAGLGSRPESGPATKFILFALIATRILITSLGPGPRAPPTRTHDHVPRPRASRPAGSDGGLWRPTHPSPRRPGGCPPPRGYRGQRAATADADEQGPAPTPPSCRSAYDQSLMGIRPLSAGTVRYPGGQGANYVDVATSSPHRRTPPSVAGMA